MNKDHIQRIYRDCEFNVVVSDQRKVTQEAWTHLQLQRLDVETLCRWSRGQIKGKDGQPFTIKDVEFVVLCGAKPWSSIPGIVVLDADDVEAMNLIEARCPRTPLRVSTPGGGMHYVYRHPGERVGQIIGHHVNGKTFKLDRKGDGGYVAAPGTISAKNGRCYASPSEWTPELIRSLPIFDPNWIKHESKATKKPIVTMTHDQALVALESAQDKRSEYAAKWLKKQCGATQGKSADKYAYKLAMKLLWGFGIDREMAIDLLYEWGQRDDQRSTSGAWYPWGYNQIRHKVDDASVDSYVGRVGDEFHSECSLELKDDFYEVIKRLNAGGSGVEQTK